MLSVFRVILLCWLCTMVTSITINFVDFDSKPGNRETLADYSQVKIRDAEINGTKVGVLTGNFTFKRNFDDSYYVDFSFLGLDSSEFDIVEGYVTVCEFLYDMSRRNMTDVLADGSEYLTSSNAECPIKAQTYQILPPDKLTQLSALANLPSGEYLANIDFIHNSLSIGGFLAHFYVVK